ncbi:MAG: hypothetical protein P1Q69_17175, partial [Candidatus Thorarchaeota archaeon]|nr:hypothetical protein [Candidatus Thorarchaeota archaeon]
KPEGSCWIRGRRSCSNPQLLEENSMHSQSIDKNTVLLTTLAVLAALGIVARIFIRIPVIPGFFELTPGFLFSELGGIVGGIPGGLFVGAVVGIGGALAGGEFPLLPMVGNMCLGLGTGIAVYLARRNSVKFSLIAILGGGIIGGFIPTMTIFAAVTDSLELTFILAIADMIQAVIWAIAAIFVDRYIIQKILGNYIYSDSSPTIELLDMGSN